jgi:hypothetical protein
VVLLYVCVWGGYKFLFVVTFFYSFFSFFGEYEVCEIFIGWFVDSFHDFLCE